MIGLDKAFRIPANVVKPDGVTVALEKNYTQADQGSDMNVMSAGLVRHLSLQLHPLSEIGFKGLSMRTADHRETVLHYWVWLRVVVEGIHCDIRCFAAPELRQTAANGQAEYMSLIVGIPWLYSVDALISIRQSKIMIGDASIREAVRAVAGPELVFYKDHNLLLYPKLVMAVSTKATVEEVDSSGYRSGAQRERAGSQGATASRLRCGSSDALKNWVPWAGEELYLNISRLLRQ